MAVPFNSGVQYAKSLSKQYVVNIDILKTLLIDIFKNVLIVVAIFKKCPYVLKIAFNDIDIEN